MNDFVPGPMEAQSPWIARPVVVPGKGEAPEELPPGLPIVLG